MPRILLILFQFIPIGDECSVSTRLSRSCGGGGSGGGRFSGLEVINIKSSVGGSNGGTNGGSIMSNSSSSSSSNTNTNTNTNISMSTVSTKSNEITPPLLSPLPPPLPLLPFPITTTVSNSSDPEPTGTATSTTSGSSSGVGGGSSSNSSSSSGGIINSGNDSHNITTSAAGGDTTTYTHNDNTDPTLDPLDLITPPTPQQQHDARHLLFELVATLPGHLHYRRSIKELRLLAIRIPSIFDNREIYLQVHKMIATHTYTLELRQEICSLFSSFAESRSSGSGSGGSGSKEDNDNTTTVIA